MKNKYYLFQYFILFLFMSIQGINYSYIGFKVTFFVIIFISNIVRNKNVIPIISGSLLIALFVIIIPLNYGKYDSLLDLEMLFGLLILNRNVNFSVGEVRVLRMFMLTFLLILLIRLISTESLFDLLKVRFIIPGLDSNVGALLFFVFFVLSRKLKSTWGTIITVSVSVLLLSRNYLLGIIVYSFVEKFDYNRVVLFFTKKLTPFSIFLILNIIIIFVAFWWELEFGSKTNVTHETGSYSRVLSLNDESNYGRFKIIVLALRFFVSDFQSFYFGVDKASVFNSLPHNTLIALVFYKGIIFSSMYLFFIFKIFGRLFIQNNYSIIVAYLVMGVTLHSLFNAVYLVPLIYSLKLQNISNE